MPTRLLRLLCAGCAALALACTLAPHLRRVHAQNTPAQRGAGTDIYAITNARIVPVAGPEIPRGTVVIRNGLIAAVGANTNAPPDARVIDGTGLTVYPGLIDANSTLGMPQPTPRAGGGGGGGGGLAFLIAQTQATPAVSAPNSTQPPGLQPELAAAELLRAGGEQIEAARNAGLTAALTVPREGIFVGQSALVNLAGDTPQQMIVRAPVALHIQFTPLRGGYPGSLMGVFAAIRQMFLDAQRMREWQTTYARNPRGVRRPEQDRSLEALLPVLAGQMPVIMYADRQREIERALDLAQEFKLKAIIAGGADAWRVADRLAAAKVPVLLSLNFPRRTTALNPEADPDPIRILRERVEAPKTAGRLAAAGVRFAFQSGGMTNMSDFIGNVGRAVENGLARDEAIRAMTLRAAEIFAADNQLGTIEPGKIANLTVVRGDLFDRTRRITHVFIDGRPVDLRPATAGAGGAGAGGANATGTWSVRVALQGQTERTITLTLQQQGEQLSGSMQGDFGPAQIANASIGRTGEIKFTAPLTTQAQTIEATFEGTLAGNEMSGTVTLTGGQPGSFTGTRSGGPPAATPAGTPPGGATATPGAARATTGGASVDLSGTWTINVELGGRPQTATLSLQQQGERLSGTLQGPQGSSEISNGSAGADGSFRFTTVLNFGQQTVELTYTGTVNGNQMNGTVTTPRGAIPFTGTRPQ